MELSAASLLKLGSFLFWSGLYLSCLVGSPHRTPEWGSRVVTLLHGSVASIAGLTQCGLTTISEYRLTAKIMPHHYALMVWSWGYFAFDLLWCLVYWTSNALMLCHHASALAAITVYMTKECTGCMFPCTLAMMEITNPLLQIRWFLRNEGYDKTLLFMLVEIAYLTLFIALRGFLGTYIVFKIMSSSIVDLDGKLVSLVFYFVSVGFLYEITGYILYKYKTQISEFKGFLAELGIILDDQA